MDREHLEIYSDDTPKKRYYNTFYRKKLISKIDKLKDKNDYTIIYNLIVDDIGNNFSSNRNGIFINMNLLSDKCIGEINEYISTKYEETPTNIRLNYC